MTKHHKYECRVTQDNDFWSAEITRRVTSSKTRVSKSQGGFSTEAEAQAWGKTEMESFLANQKKRNVRHSENQK